jgi:D-glycero-alpha-D-manno-heptose 1-phosphate guanylyltransferase
MKEVVVLAGGQGTRLRSVVNDRPKPMADVGGRPFLAWQMDALIAGGAEKVILAVGYMSESIRAYFKSGYKDLSLEFSVENSPLGTGGAVRQALQSCSSPFPIVVNGDTFSPYEFESLSLAMNSSLEAVIAAIRMPDALRYAVLDVDPISHLIKGFLAKGASGEGLINAGTYVLNKDAFLARSFPERFSLETDYFERFCKNDIFRAVETKPPFIDIGIPEDLLRAQSYIPQAVGSLAAQ